MALPASNGKRVSRKKLITLARYSSTPDCVRSRGLENMARERGHQDHIAPMAVERRLPITLEMHGIFIARPKE